MYELLHYRAVGISCHCSPGYPEISVEPGVPQASSVSLHTDLYEPFPLLLADRFDAQTWRVGMGSYHGDRIARLPFFADREGDYG